MLAWAGIFAGQRILLAKENTLNPYLQGKEKPTDEKFPNFFSQKWISDLTRLS